MHRMLRTTILITFGMFIICIVGGCSEDSPEVVTVPSNPTTSRGTPSGLDDIPPHQMLGGVDPAPGGAPIPPNTQFSLIFDQAVVAVTVNGVAATGAGDRWTVSPILPQGEGQNLNIIWTNRDGSKEYKIVGPYAVRVPDTTPPRITDGTVADGSVNVDPAPLNAGGIEITFDEEVTAFIMLTDEAGADLNWSVVVQGRMATLHLRPITGLELVSETTYKIEIDVHDGAGNQTRMTITFVTKPK